MLNVIVCEQVTKNRLLWKWLLDIVSLVGTSWICDSVLRHSLGLISDGIKDFESHVVPLGSIESTLQVVVDLVEFSN